MDADDWMHRERLDAQCLALESAPRLAAVGSHVRIFPRTGVRDPCERALPGEPDVARMGRRGYEAWLNAMRDPADVAREAFVECPIAHPTLFARREVIARHGYRDRGWAEDYDLVLRMLAAGDSIGIVPRRLLGWRDDPRRLSRDDARYAADRFTACKARHLADGLLADHAHYILWGHGSTGRALRRALARLERDPSHIIEMHPRRIGQTIHGATVHHPDEIPMLPRRPILASVAGAGPRREIRAALASIGRVEGRDFVCAA